MPQKAGPTRSKSPMHVGTMYLAPFVGLLGLILLVAIIFVSKPSSAIVLATNVRDSTTESGQVSINGAGICYRTDETDWQCQVALFGTYGYSDLPVYASRMAFSLGVFRFVFNNLAVAYAMAGALFFVLVVASACIAQHSGESFAHKHHHIYRPLILKALSYLNAFATGIACVAAVNTWQMVQACIYLQRADSSLKFQMGTGFYVVLCAFLFHLVSLILTFVLAAKSRIHLRDPAVVLMALANNERARRKLQFGRSQGSLEKAGMTMTQSDIPKVKDHDWIVKNLGFAPAEADAQTSQSSRKQRGTSYQASDSGSTFQIVEHSKSNPANASNGSNLQLPPPLRKQSRPSQKVPPDRNDPYNQSVPPLSISTKRAAQSTSAQSNPAPPYTPRADSAFEMSDFVAGQENDYSPVNKRRQR